MCAAWVLTVSAQKQTADVNRSIENIRKEYQAVHDWIARMMPNEEGATDYPPEYYDLQVEQNLPGTGPHHERHRMFYCEQEQDEDDEYDPFPAHYLRFATAKYNFAAREFYEEYLYNEKGQVMFIYAITPDVEDATINPYELRLWFDGSRLLRFTVKKAEDALDDINIATLQKTPFKEVYSGTAIPAIYQREAQRVQSRAVRFLSLFESIDENTYR